MSDLHTATPWEVIDGRFIRQSGNPRHVIARVSKGDAMEANARRIVACVNACAGIRTEALEHRAHLLKAEDDTLASLRRQRDELLAALNLIEVDKDGDGFICREAMDVVRKLWLTKAGDDHGK